MNTLDALLTRNSSPRLTNPIPSEEQLEIAYKCALRAPDHAWIRPWKFIQISEQGLDRLSDAFVNTAKKLDSNIELIEFAQTLEKVCIDCVEKTALFPVQIWLLQYKLFKLVLN